MTEKFGAVQHGVYTMSDHKLLGAIDSEMCDNHYTATESLVKYLALHEWHTAVDDSTIYIYQLTGQTTYACNPTTYTPSVLANAYEQAIQKSIRHKIVQTSDNMNVLYLLMPEPTEFDDFDDMQAVLFSDYNIWP